MQFKHEFKWIPVLLSILVLCVSVLPAAAESAGAEYDISSLNYELVWADEFDTDGLPDPARWAYNTGGNGWGNGEQQYYMAEGNAAIENGILTIELREEKSSYYTSARMITKNLGDWLYGKIEVRAKLPSGRGTWPAIWMLPTDKVYGDWPASGRSTLWNTWDMIPTWLYRASTQRKRTEVQQSARAPSFPEQGKNFMFTDWNGCRTGSSLPSTGNRRMHMKSRRRPKTKRSQTYGRLTSACIC